MNDRELTELAAKAAGINLEWDGHPDEWQPMYYEGKTYHSFEPLTDDGDALRLAVKLQLLMNIGTQATFANNKVNGETDKWAREQHEDSDPFTATRRAIVRAAAEIGKAM